jgi:4-hydroxybenzoate polyprenyltransferase
MEDPVIWALLAAFLTKRPPWVQAIVVGLCTGLFVTAGAYANERDPLIGWVVLLVLAVAVLAGAAFYLALRARLRHGWAAGSAPPTWVNLVYAAVWLLSLIAAIRALFGAGGLKVAVLAIVPIVLLTPPALVSIRALLGRSPAHDGDAPTAAGP